LPFALESPKVRTSLDVRFHTRGRRRSGYPMFARTSAMITVYYKSGNAQWKYELDESEHQYIIKNVLDDSPDINDMFDDSLEILRDISAMEDTEMDEDDEIDQTIAVSFLWHYFNHLAEGDDRIEGDIVLIEEEDGSGVTVLPADALAEGDDE